MPWAISGFTRPPQYSFLYVVRHNKGTSTLLRPRARGLFLFIELQRKYVLHGDVLVCRLLFIELQRKYVLHGDVIVCRLLRCR